MPASLLRKAEGRLSHQHRALFFQEDLDAAKLPGKVPGFQSPGMFSVIFVLFAPLILEGLM